MVDEHFELVLSLLLLEHLLAFEELHQSLLIVLQRLLDFLFDVELFSGIFGTLNPAFQVLHLQPVAFEVLLVVGLGQHVLEGFEIARVELNGFEQFVHVLLSLRLLLPFSLIVFAHQ